MSTGHSIGNGVYTSDEDAFAYPGGGGGSAENSAEDYVISGAVMAPAASADQIESENTFSQVEPGEHVLVIKGFPGGVRHDRAAVFMPGTNEMAGYDDVAVNVEFCLPGSPRTTIRDRFHLPPEGREAQMAYHTGKTRPEDADTRGGFQSKKLVHFLDRIGFPIPPGGQIPPAALALRNWKGRAVKATVTKGKPFTDKNGNTKDGYNNIKLFSYASVNAANAAGGGQPGGNAATQGRPASPTQRPDGPASQAANAGLDNI